MAAVGNDPVDLIVVATSFPILLLASVSFTGLALSPGHWH